MAKATISERIAALKREAQLSYEINEKMRGSLSNILSAYKDIAAIQMQINYLKSLGYDDTTKEGRAVLANIAAYEKQLALLKASATSAKNIGIAMAKDVGRGISSLFSSIYNFAKTSIKSSISYFYEQDKAVRSAQLQMGILSSNSKVFSDNIYKAALTTTKLGASAADLAEMQADYSANIGRAVVLTQAGLEAMAEMAQGTALGKEGAAAMAGYMDIFGLSASDAASYVKETTVLAKSMGVNASTVLAKLQTNLKLAQGYNFKEGTKGIAKMTALSEKTRIEFEDITSMVDKLITPEGAVEMAANLQVLGGAWAQLADPFTLMYQARNDVAALTKSISEAASATAQFNKKTGEFDISALEMNRLRQVAEATGMDYATLAESARETAKFAKIKGEVGFKFDDTYEEFIESTAQWDKSKGMYYIQMGTSPDSKTYLKDLNQASASSLKNLMEQKDTLAEQAITAESFDEYWTNIVNTFKTVLLPFLDGMFEGIRGAFAGFTDITKNESLYKQLSESGKSIGKSIGAWVTKLGKIITEFGPQILSVATAIAKFIVDNPIKTAIAALATYGLFQATKWYLNGVMLGMGFNSTASLTGGAGGIGSSLLKSLPRETYSSMRGAGYGVGTSMLESRSLPGMSRFGTGLLGAGVSLGSMYGGYELSKAGNTGAGYGLGIGGGALGGATTGFSIGGPWGALIGGILGAAGGALSSYAGSTANKPTSYAETRGVMNDFISRPGEGAVPISSKDTVIGMEKYGPLSKATKAESKEMSHTFEPMKIEFGTLKIDGGHGLANTEFEKDPIFMRKLTRIIQQNIRGKMKISSNPT